MKQQAWLMPILLAFGVPLATHAQSARPSGSLTDQVDQDETVYLSPFEVSSDRAGSYNVVESTATRLRTAILDTPTSIQVVTSEFMDDIGAASILDATQYLSGMSVPALGGANGIQDRQVVRGFNSFGSSIDNFRIRILAGSAFDLSVVDRVEVIKGPNAFLSPGGGVGGFATSVSKSPKFESANLLRVEVADEYFGSKATFDSTGKIPGTERFAYRLIGTYRDSKSYVPGRILMKTINPMLTWRISDKSQLKLKGFVSNWGQKGAQAQNANNLYIRDDFPYGTGATISKADIKPGYTPFAANAAVDWTERDQKQRMASAEFTTALTSQLNLRMAVLHHTWTGFDDSWTGVNYQRAGLLRIDPNTGRDTPNLSWALEDPNQPWHEQTNRYVSTPIAPNSDITKVELRQGYRSPDNLWDGETHYQVDLAGKFDFGGTSSDPLFTLNTIVGAYYTIGRTKAFYSYDITVEDITGLYDLTTMPFIPNARPPTMPSGARPLKWDRDVIKAEAKQHYASVQLDTFRKRLILMGSVSNLKNISITRDSNGTNHLERDKTVPSGGALFKVTSNSSVYVNHSRNAAQSSYYPGSGLPNREIWQDFVQNEAGVKVELFNRKLSISAAYFDIERTNQAVTDPRDIEADRSGLNRLYPQTLNTSNSEGFEFDIAGQVTPSLSIMGSATKQKKRNQVGFKDANTPDEMYNGLVRYGFSSGALDGLSLHLGFNHSGKSVGNNPNVNPTILGVRHQYLYYLPARTIFNAGAGYRWKQVDFRLNVDNLFDTDKPYVSGGRHAVGLALPRNVRLTTTIHF